MAPSFEDGAMRLAAGTSALKAWVSGGCPRVLWIVEGKSYFRWRSALLAGIGIVSIVVARRLLGWLYEREEENRQRKSTKDRDPQASSSAPSQRSAANKKPADEPTASESGGDHGEGFDDDEWDTVHAPKDAHTSLADSVVMVPEKTVKSPAVNLEKSVVFVSHEDEPFDDIGAATPSFSNKLQTAGSTEGGHANMQFDKDSVSWSGNEADLDAFEDMEASHTQALQDDDSTFFKMVPQEVDALQKAGEEQLGNMSAWLREGMRPWSPEEAEEQPAK